MFTKMKIGTIALILLTVFTTTSTFSQNFSQAVKLFNEKSYDEAFTIFNSIPRGNQRYAESRYYMGQISLQRQDLSKAEEYLKQAISTNGEVAKYHVAMTRVILQQISRSSMLRQATLAGRLRTHLEEAVRLNPNDMNSSIMLVGFYMQAPGLMGGDSSKAKTLASQMQKINRADGFLALGLIAQMEKNTSEAESNYKKAITASPDSSKSHVSLAQFYQSQQEYAKAINVMENAITKLPAERSLLLQAGRFAALGGKDFSEKGKKHLNSYIANTPDKKDRTLADAYYFLGLIENNEGNSTQAKRHFKSALSLNPDHTRSKNALKEFN